MRTKVNTTQRVGHIEFLKYRCEHAGITHTTWSMALVILLFFLACESAWAVAIPKFELAPGDSVLITNDYERTTRGRKSVDEQALFYDDKTWIRQIIHVAPELRHSEKDEWIFWELMSKASKGDRINPSRQYDDGPLHKVKVRYHINDEELVFAPVEENGSYELTEEQRESITNIANGKTYFAAMTAMASARKYPLKQEFEMSPEDLEAYFEGTSGTITLNSTMKMWEQEVAEFEVLTVAEGFTGGCSIIFWILVQSGRPVNLSKVCNFEKSADGNDDYLAVYVSRAFSYQNHPISKLSPTPLPAMQPNGDLLGLEFSESTGQLVFLTKEFNSNNAWLTFWDLQQRKLLRSVKALEGMLTLSKGDRAIYAINPEHRTISSWMNIDGAYESFGLNQDANFEINKDIKDVSLLGLYPVTLNSQNEIEVWNPGTNRIGIRKKLQHSQPEYLAVAPDGRLLTAHSSGELYLHELRIDTTACNTDLESTYCEAPRIFFRESDKPIKVSFEIIEREGILFAAKLAQFDLHESEPVIIYCTEHPSECAVINYETGEQWQPGVSSNAQFTSEGKVVADNGIFDLIGTEIAKHEALDLFDGGAAISETAGVTFNNAPNFSSQFIDRQIILSDTVSGETIDTLVRNTYPIGSIASPYSNGINFLHHSTSGNSLRRLALDTFEIQSSPKLFGITKISANSKWNLLKGGSLSLLISSDSPYTSVKLEFSFGAYVLLKDTLVYVQDNSVYRRNIQSGETEKLHSFDSQIFSFEVLDAVGDELVVQLTNGRFALPHVDKILELPYQGRNGQALMFDDTSGTFFVAGLHGYSKAFNPAIEQVVQFSSDGTVLLDMAPASWGSVHVMATSDTGQLWSGGNDGVLIIWDIGSGLMIERIDAHEGSFTAIEQIDENTMVTAAADGTMKLWRLDVPNGKFKNSQLGALYPAFIESDIGRRQTKLIATIVVDKDGEALISTPDGYYWSTPQAIHQASFLNDGKLFDYVQYDFWLNRPDIVLNRLGKGSEESISLWKKIVQIRQARQPGKPKSIPMDEVAPVLSLIGPDKILAKDKVSLAYKIETGERQPDRLHLLVNHVPVFGTRGQQIEAMQGKIDVELNDGINRIKAYVSSADGLQSETQFLTYNKPYSDDKPDLYLLTIGVSDYANDALDLNYAAKDATDMQALFKNSTRYARIHSKILLNTDVTTAGVIAAKRFVMQSKPTDHVIVFFAGHGFLDGENNYFFGTVDIDPYEPGTSGLAYENITALLDGIDSRNKLLMLDTCHSGEVTQPFTDAVLPNGVSSRGLRLKRKSRDNANLGLSFELLQKSFVDLRASTGAVVISASGGQEYAFETDEIKNGIFTASVIKALTGKAADSNGDGEVSTTELRAYTYGEVIRLTNGQQKPTTRNYNLDFDFSVF